MSLIPSLDTIVLFGDSITEFSWDSGGFAQQLAFVYSRKLDVINRGYSGYNTEWAIPVFEQLFAKKEKQELYPKCKLLVIWFGANDSTLPESPQHVPLEKFKENLTWLIQAIKSPTSQYYAPWTRIIVITAPPSQVDVWAAYLAQGDPLALPYRTWESTLQYVEATREVAKKEGVPLVDAWDAIWKTAGEKTEALTPFLSDGLHLTKEGYQIVYKKVIEVILTDFPELHYDKLIPVFPEWDAVDPKNPRPTLNSRYVDI